ncbi:MAG TPA: hypothetical protein VNS62_11165 [Candidatus Udaeobacter sp.]|nr:hypothetical protein [Candidatus Udaeobacter sp.]
MTDTSAQPPPAANSPDIKAFTTTLLEIILNREPVPPVNIFQWSP